MTAIENKNGNVKPIAASWLIFPVHVKNSVTVTVKIPEKMAPKKIKGELISCTIKKVTTIPNNIAWLSASLMSDAPRKIKKLPGRTHASAVTIVIKSNCR